MELYVMNQHKILHEGQGKCIEFAELFTHKKLASTHSAKRYFRGPSRVYIYIFKKIIN